ASRDGSWGSVSAVDPSDRAIFPADAHRGDGMRWLCTRMTNCRFLWKLESEDLNCVSARCNVKTIFGLLFHYLFLLADWRLHVDCGDFSCCRIYAPFSDIFFARLRNIERPDQHPVFFLELSTLDRAILDSSQRNSFGLMLRHARLLKQFRFTLLCAHIEGCPARGEC